MMSPLSATTQIEHSDQDCPSPEEAITRLAYFRCVARRSIKAGISARLQRDRKLQRASKLAHQTDRN